MAGHEQSIRLRVADAQLEDVAEGRARLSRDVFDALRLKRGELVQIAGPQKVLASAFPAGPEDDGLNLVRLDGTIRRRLAVDIGEAVEVRRYDPRVAKRVRLVAIGDSRALGELTPEDVRATLAEQTIIVG